VTQTFQKSFQKTAQIRDTFSWKWKILLSTMTRWIKYKFEQFNHPSKQHFTTRIQYCCRNRVTQSTGKLKYSYVIWQFFKDFSFINTVKLRYLSEIIMDSYRYYNDNEDLNKYHNKSHCRLQHLTTWDDNVLSSFLGNILFLLKSNQNIAIIDI
jgi:hypothetical protein